MGKVFKTLYAYSANGKPKAPISLHLTKEAMNVYRKSHDHVVSFRKEMRRHDHTSVVCKSLGLLLRVAGVLNRLRESTNLVIDQNYEMENVITENDILMAKELIHYSVETSLLALGNEKCEDKVMPKSGIPMPENMSVEFLVTHVRHVRKIVKFKELPMRKITANNLYPTIGKMKGSDAARRFVNGLIHVGLGEIQERENEGKGQGKSLFSYDNNISGDQRNRVKDLWERLDLDASLCTQVEESRSTDLSEASQRLIEIVDTVKENVKPCLR